MNETVYLVDNMVICSRAIGPYLNSDFMKEHAWVIDEVIYESRNSARSADIRQLQHHTTAKDLEVLKQISHDCIDKYKFLKLYEGCADAMLVATALAINEPENGQNRSIFTKTPIVVTEERSVQRACDDLNIQWMSQVDFVSLLKATNLQELPLGV